MNFNFKRLFKKKEKKVYLDELNDDTTLKSIVPEGNYCCIDMDYPYYTKCVFLNFNEKKENHYCRLKCEAVRRSLVKKCSISNGNLLTIANEDFHNLKRESKNEN